MKKSIYVIIIVLLVVNLYIGYRTYSVHRTSLSVSKQKEYASALVDQGLYKEAAEVYDKLIESSSLSLKGKANLSYIVGNLYMERINDYENALKYYLRIKVFDKKNIGV